MTSPENDISVSANQKYYYETKENESKRPPDLKFIQQRLPTGHPVLNTAYVLPTFTILSLIFIPLGIGIWLFAENIPELTITYSDCKSLENSSMTCEEIVHAGLPKSHIRHANLNNCNCRVDFTLEKDMTGTIYMYYALTNFYQNHLRYYQSRDPNQLKGNVGEFNDLTSPSDFCEPYAYEFSKEDVEEGRSKDRGRIMFPCGLQANTMFNDVIQLVHIDPERYPLIQDGERKVPLLRTGIAWDSDKGDKFQNPRHFNNFKHPMWINFIKPWAWKTDLWGLDIQNISNNGLENEDFIVWMKTAAFPNFRKMYRIVDSTKTPFQNGLPAGNYSLFIEYNFEVSSFEGTKSIIFTITRMTAGRNHFLGTAYMVTGSILLVLDVIFFIVHILTRKRDLTFKDD